jgi:energy-coupling factor transporter transmembrane protein EcfT
MLDLKAGNYSDGIDEKPSWAALLSVICGLVFCIPPTVLIAFISSIYALRSTKKQRGGRRLAWIGLFLSCLGIGFMGWFFYVSFILAEPAAHFTKLFFDDLANDRVQLAQSKCDGGVPAADVANWAAGIQEFGKPITIECTRPLFHAAQRRNENELTYSLEATVSGPNKIQTVLGVDLIRVGGEFRVWNLHAFAPVNRSGGP